MRITALFLFLLLFTKTSLVLSEVQVGAFQVFSTEPFEGAFAIYDLSEDLQLEDVAIEVVQDEAAYASRQMPFLDYLQTLSIEALSGDGEIAVFVRNQSRIDNDNIAILLNLDLPNQDPILEEILTAPRLNDPSEADAGIEAALPADPAAVPETLPELEEISLETIDIIPSDNLENISQAIKQAFYRQESLSLEQVMTAVRRTNIYAFSNYDLLPDTQIERPSFDEISSQSARLAKEEIQQNYGPLMRDRPRSQGGSSLSILALETQDEITNLLGELNELDKGQDRNYIQIDENQDQRLDSLSQQIAVKAQQLEALERKIQEKQGQKNPSIASDAYGDVLAEYEFILLILLSLIIATLIYKLFLKKPEPHFVQFSDPYSGSGDRYNDFSFSGYNNPPAGNYGQAYDSGFPEPRLAVAPSQPPQTYAPGAYQPAPPTYPQTQTMPVNYPNDDFVTIPKQTYIDLTLQNPNHDLRRPVENFRKKKA